MALHRRHLLTALGTTGVAALAGCPSRGGNELSEHTTKLVPADGDAGDEFGASVAVAGDGTTALVGAPEVEDAGAAYVFELSDGSWRQEAKLAAAADSDDEFGWSVAVAADGTTAIDGARWDEDPYDEFAGAAYIFERAGYSWRQRAKLAAADGDSGDEFGDSVAVAADGTTALVGAPEDEDPNGEDAGAAYVFERAGGSWHQQVKLGAADGDSDDLFGRSVAVVADGTTALLGAPGDVDPNGEEAGAAYVFHAAGGSWTQQAKLAAADGAGDGFGVSVAVAADGTTALVGTDLGEEPNGENAGSAYVFKREGGSWTQQANLAPADGDSGDEFGASVAVAADGTTALVSAPRDQEPNGKHAGSAYVFEWAGGAWHQLAKLTPADGDSEDHFGSSVAVAADGTTAIVGTLRDEDPNGNDAGSAYVFERSGGSWHQ